MRNDMTFDKDSLDIDAIMQGLDEMLYDDAIDYIDAVNHFERINAQDNE